MKKKLLSVMFALGLMFASHTVNAKPIKICLVISSRDESMSRQKWINIDSDSTISTLYKYASNSEDYHAIYCGDILLDKFTLNFYEVKDNSIIVLVPREQKDNQILEKIRHMEETNEEIAKLNDNFINRTLFYDKGKTLMNLNSIEKARRLYYLMSDHKHRIPTNISYTPCIREDPIPIAFEDEPLKDIATFILGKH